MNIKSQKDFFSGLMFMGVGVAFAWGASTYSVGTGARMGPGYFPLVLGVLLAILGIAITFTALVVETEDGDKIGKFAWKPLFFIIAANLVFGASIGGLPVIGLKPLGLIVGIYLLTYIASHAGEEHKFKEVAVLATILALLSYVAFIVLLKLQFPVWPAYFTA
ncbi:tripartite tricarboxylate transporter TctB family protein [Rhodoferax mekongensis]|uniref:Tripartite tricarboxylate transporter TctB family protein n=1 Tax=Rhodoferax mekongensis TaxID=3068341 RepID=A0ABZ0AY52_9BURK|nr:MULTISPECIES: tripartite tricarboxylate transporter TctB family protein [unclassified Rhodoferax]MDT7514825.1 tripartite tricarboxylate transporter TctB family protein [Rhodoferax sp. TBRC 17199]WNO04420.1 tripartite tricarboxylate transporter TctB family protein [Rhodoferax sp. TBRC 17307]